MKTITQFVISAVALLAVASSASAAPPALDEAAWTKVFGTQADGLAPTLVKGLEEGMSPAAAGAIFKGADKPSKFGFAKLPVKGVPGVKKMELYFRKDVNTGLPTVLAAVTLTLDPSVMKKPEVYDALMKVLTAKYGAVRKPETIPSFQVTWTPASGKTAQVWKIGRDLTFKFGY